MTAGCDHPVVLRALRDRIDRLEALRVLELLYSEQPGSRLGNRLAEWEPQPRTHRGYEWAVPPGCTSAAGTHTWPGCLFGSVHPQPDELTQG